MASLEVCVEIPSHRITRTLILLPIEYTSRDFIHRHSVLAYMAWKSVVQASKEADDIFG